MYENDNEMEQLNWAGDNGVIGLSLSIYIMLSVIFTKGMHRLVANQE
jgi:hypothetical protein